MQIIHPRLLPLCAALMLALVPLAGALRAQPSDDPDAPQQDTTAESARKETDILSLGIEFVPTPGNGTFFDRYAVLGGNTTHLGAASLPMAALRLATSSQFRVVVFGSFAGVKFTDIYGISDSTSSQVHPGFASLVEEFTATAIPVMAGIEYAGIRTQFTSYAGIAAGVAYTSVEWQTTTREQTIGDFYRPSINVHGDGVSPAARLYAGVDYRFDRNFLEQGTVRGIFLEGSYLFLPLVRDYFALVRRQGRGLKNLPPNDSGLLNLGGFTFAVGVNLQFVRH